MTTREFCLFLMLGLATILNAVALGNIARRMDVLEARATKLEACE